MGLRLKQQLFVSYYLGKAKGNGALAARLAKYGAPKEAAARLLTFANVKSAIAEKLAAVAMDQDEVLARLSRQAASDMGDFLGPVLDPDLVPSFDFAKAKRRDQLANIKKIKRTRRTIARRDEPPEVVDEVELQVFDPRPALETLAKFHGLTYEPEPEDLKSKSNEELERLAEDKGRRRT